MKKLLVYLKNYIKECILGPLFKLFEASLELIVPLIIAAIMDTGIGSIPGEGDPAYVVKMCLLLVLFAIAGLIAAVSAQYFAAKAAVGFATELRHSLFEHMTKLSFAQTDHQGTDTLITRMTGDINQLQNGVNLTIRLLLRSPFIVFGAMIMAFTVDVKAALIFVVLIPVLAVAVFALLLMGVPKFKKVQAATDKLTGKTRENLTGVRVIRAFGREETENESFITATDVLEKLQTRAANFTALMNPVTYIIVNLGLIALIYSGAVQVKLGNLSRGEVVALVNYMSYILVELIKLANLIITVTKAVACGNRVAEVLELPEGLEITETTPVENKPGRLPKVSFKNVSINYYAGADEALHDVSFDAYPGETIGIIGGTGSGKSTLVNMIPRFYDCTEGQILVDGKDVKAYDPVELRDKVVTVLQKAILFKGTIRENLLWGNENATDEDLHAALRAAQAEDFVMQKEGGLDAKVEQEGRNFSGGQRQRLSIARALVKKPEILILDDSCSALDYATDAALRKAIATEFKGTTLFIVSQRATTLANANKIVVLDDGEAVGIGTHAELLENCEVYKEICNV